jgi:peptide/nickel transport system substrate-binding protein
LAYSEQLTNEELVQGDWPRGPAGTGEVDWMTGGNARFTYKTGCLAESWEIPQLGTIIFHIRQGVHWALNPKSEASRLVNGREFTADDAVFNIKRAFTEPRSYMKLAYPTIAATLEVTAPDRWTVVVKCDPSQHSIMLCSIPDAILHVPSEVVAKFGNLTDWRNSVGTGPFMLTDFVSNSQATFVRNPNYWGKDPVGPGKGNQLPYLDSFKYVVIPDLSTRLAAMRTGKLDFIGIVSWDDGNFLRETNPELKFAKFMHDSTMNIFMRTDRSDLPFKDKRVRQALSMGIDRDVIIREFSGGEGLKVCWPIIYVKDYKDAYVPLEELPPQVQELYTYNPEKAKQLLKDAGYLIGFKTTILCTAAYVDFLSVIKADWAKIGVELALDVRDTAVFTVIKSNKTYAEMVYTSNAGIGCYDWGINWNGPSEWNTSCIDDPVAKAALAEMNKLTAGVEDAKIDKVHAGLMPYLLEQAYVITRPQGYIYHFWQPWVKNYYGDVSVGYYTWQLSAKYRWIDQALKKQMTGQ